MSKLRSRLFALVVLTLPGVALADPSRVRVVTAQASDPVVTRICAELVAEGFACVIEAPAHDPRTDVEAASDAFASITIEREGAAADVWVADHVTGKTLVRRVEAADARALAIRAVDLLRASLLEVREPVAVVPVVAKPPPKDVVRFIAPRVRHEDAWSTEIGAGITKNVGFGPSFAPLARLSRTIGRGFALRLTWMGPSFGPDVTTFAGTAQVHQIFGLAEMLYAIDTGRLSPHFAIGLGAAETLASGNARAPYTSLSADGASFAIAASAGLRLRLASHVALSLETGSILLAPTRAIAILGSDVANRSPLSWVTTFGFVTSFD